MDFDFVSMDHEYFMQEALKEAEIAAQTGEIPVGAVIVHAKRIAGRNHAKHEMRKSEIAHAEMNVLIQAEQYLSVHARDNCIIYTTVEPCVMCLGAIVMSNIAHIVYGRPDN
jgi:tRNA(adenine34) deaminase